MSEETFYFDEFFSDGTVDILLPVRGRQVPITIRRGMTLKEKAAAQGTALKRHVDPNTGRIIIDSIDEGRAAEEVAFRMLVKWPFVDRATGEPVPITRENVSKMIGGLETLFGIIQTMEAEGDEALIPFAVRSATVSDQPPAQE